MSTMPSTFTVNVGNPAGDVIFTHSHYNGKNRVYYAPSPTNDLAGRPECQLASSVSGSGLRRTSITWKWPISVGGVYSGHVQSSATIIRPDTADLALVDKVLEALHEFFAITNVRAAIGKDALGS